MIEKPIRIRETCVRKYFDVGNNLLWGYDAEIVFQDVFVNVHHYYNIVSHAICCTGQLFCELKKVS